MLLTQSICNSIQATDKPIKKFDGNGLFLLVTPAGRKYWRMNYRFAGKSKTLAFGVYPDVSLKEAREQRDAARKLLSNDIDPAEEKKAAKRELNINATNSFEAIGREWHENRKDNWAESYCNKISTVLEADVYPEIGNRPIREITAPELLEVIRNIEKRGALNIAKKTLQWCGQIFRYAIATGRAQRDPSRDLTGALKPAKTRHQPFLPEQELPQFLQKLDQYDGDDLTALALHLMVLTFPRTTELRAAGWNEFDFEKAEWRIPSERMKMQQMHIVPLSRQAISVIDRIRKISENNALVFPMRHNPFKCMSENTMLYALYRMGYHSRATVHGFRSTASTILNENGFPPDVIERQLAHQERNHIRAAYNHAEYLPERRKMMQWWADHLDMLRAQQTSI